jgi:trimethylamine--corrinoid protein Co-methyltransferase
MDHGALVSPAYMVLVNEILHNVNQFMNGLPVTDETLAVDLIDRVGPSGHYLQENHTMKHFRKVRYSQLFDRSVYDQWKEAGGKRFEERLRELTRVAMDHKPAPLTSDVTRELDRMQAHWQ